MNQTETTYQLYQEIIGVHSPWAVTSVTKDEATRTVTVRIEYTGEAAFVCPICGQVAKRHDHRKRVLRYLDTCQYETFLEVLVPRVKCSVDGLKQIAIPFAEKHSRFTSRFEMAVMLWLQSSTISDVAKNMHLSWDEVDGIMQRAVRRGLSRRESKPIIHLGIDETSYQKRHEYVTVLLDKSDGSVIDILQDRKAETLKNWLKMRENHGLGQIESITMDMWDPYIKAVRAVVPDWGKKVAFDRFHVSKHFNDGVDKVRREEHRSFLKEAGYSPLAKTRFDWLANSQRIDNRSTKRRCFLDLSRLNLKTSRAWQIKENANALWDYTYMNVAENAWKKLLGWISRSRIPEMVKVGKTVKNYLWGILNAVRLKTTNSMVEAKNARIQHIKNMACGFRNRDRFRNAILFHLGKLDMGFSTI